MAEEVTKPSVTQPQPTAKTAKPEPKGFSGSAGMTGGGHGFTKEEVEAAAAKKRDK